MEEAARILLLLLPFFGVVMMGGGRFRFYQRGRICGFNWVIRSMNGWMDGLFGQLTLFLGS